MSRRGIQTSGAALAAIALGAGGALASAALGAPTGGGQITAPNANPPSAAQVRHADELYRGYGAPQPPSAAAKRAGRRGFPKQRIVALYGSAHPGFGELGRKTPNKAQQRVKKQAVPYKRRGNRPVVRGFDLVATVAVHCERHRDKCRRRISDDTVKKYLDKIRELDGVLILDIQPGRSTFLDEIRHWRHFLAKPDVGVGLDPEWNVGPHGHPGQDAGSTNAKTLNNVSARLKRIAHNNHLPDKLMIVHQFRRGSIRHRGQLKERNRVDFTLNFDGIGRKRPKKSGYQSLQHPPLWNGFSLFYNLDTNLMTPAEVMRLKPKPDYVMYQ
jgi:hypothetical protein